MKGLTGIPCAKKKGMVSNLQKLASIPETRTSIWRLKGLDGLNVNNVSHKSHTYRRWSANWHVKCELLHQNYIMVGAYEFNKAPTCPDPRWRSALTFHVLKPPPIRRCLVLKPIISSNKSSEKIELSAEYQQTQAFSTLWLCQNSELEHGPVEIVDLPMNIMVDLSSSLWPRSIEIARKNWGFYQRWISPRCPRQTSDVGLAFAILRAHVHLPGANEGSLLTKHRWSWWSWCNFFWVK